jgi:ribonuclease P protein component
MPKDVGSLDMIRSAVDFRAMQAQSRSRTHPLLLLRYRRNDLDRTRYGISTGRRVGTAVARNAVRRRLRTVLRRLDADVERGFDVLVIARQPAAAASQAELETALLRLLANAGLLTEPVRGGTAPGTQES